VIQTIVTKVQIIVGSSRPQRNADRVVPWVVERAEEHPGLEVELLDLRDWELPMFEEQSAIFHESPIPEFASAIVEEWNYKIAEADGYIFITPEYNHSIPAVLKNAIDSVFESFALRNKPAAFVGYSRGMAAGIRAVEQLAMIAIETELIPLRNAVLIARVESAFGEDGRPIDPASETSLEILLEDLAWWATVLRRARIDGELPPAQYRRGAASEYRLKLSPREHASEQADPKAHNTSVNK
jgi:NAD(P)H-dependent FMN reductase